MPDHYAYTVIDPSTHAKTKEKGGYRFSVADEYLDAGIPTISAQNDVRAGINRVKEYFRIDPERYHPFLRDADGEFLRGAPRIFIFPQCENLIEEIGQYRWKTYSGKMLANADRDDPKEAPVKRNDHSIDSLRYGIMSRPQSPGMAAGIEPWVFNNPMELARRAQQMGVTKEDLIMNRYARTRIKHSRSGIRHSSGLRDNTLK